MREHNPILLDDAAVKVKDHTRVTNATSQPPANMAQSYHRLHMIVDDYCLQIGTPDRIRTYIPSSYAVFMERVETVDDTGA